LARLQLEVLTNNPAAIALYAGEGFVRERTLRIFARRRCPRPTRPAPS
jgi:ribosomal protein S18 acetylase RimI-like enzyme